jgi:hypothetical protein
VKYREFRFSWIPFAGLLLAFVGYPLTALSILSKKEYVVLLAIGVASIVLGNLLLVFSPKNEHKEYFRLPHKILVIGFALFVITGALNAFGFSSSLTGVLFFVSLVLFILGIIGISKFQFKNRRRKPYHHPTRDHRIKNASNLKRPLAFLFENNPYPFNKFFNNSLT